LTFAVAVILAVMVATTSMAANLTWDHDANGSASDGGGAWLGANQWVGPATWNNATPDNAIIGSGGTGGTLDLGTGVTAGTVTFGNFNGTYTMANNILTVNTGMTLGTGSGVVHFSSAAGTGFAGSGTVTINGVYPVSKSGPTQLSFWQLNETNNNFTGTYDVRNGILFTQGGDKTGGGQTVDAGSTISLNGAAGASNGAVFSSRWGGLMNRDLGTGAGEIQVIGNRSGFEGQGTNGLTVRLNNDATTPIVWGSANFNPNELILQSPNANTNAPVSFDNTLDLNGANRTISVDVETPYAWDSTGNNDSHTGRAQMNRAMTGTGGLVKEGVGQLYLTTANSYSGGTTVNEGILTYAVAAGMPTTGTTTFNDGTQIRVEVGNANEFNDTGTGAGTINGLLNGTGQGGATVNYNGDVDVMVVLTQNGQNLNLDLSDLGGGGATTNLAIIERDFTLSGNNTFSGTLKVSKRGGSARTMTLGSSTALQNADVILDTSGSTVLDLNGNNATIAKLITGSNNGGVRGRVVDNVGGGTLTLTDGVFSDDHNNGGGGIFVDTVDLNGGTQTFDVRDSGSFAASVGDFLITSVIQNGSLTMNGLEPNASLRLEGVNTYTGDTTVSAGVLNLASSGELRFDLQDGGVSNRILGSGTLLLDGLLRLDDSAVTDPMVTWNLVDVGSLSETFGGTFGLGLVGGPSFNNDGGGLYSLINGLDTWNFDSSTGDLTLLTTASVPEPATFILATLGLLSLGMIRRRRRR
jgi:autotransporter-associated beta strand protein